MILEVRNIRKKLLKKIIKEYEGEVWCISKHLLAASYRLMEVGTKQLDFGKKEEAYEFFEGAFDLYSLFWGLNMGLVNTSTSNSKQMEVEQLSIRGTQKNGFMGKLKNLVQKAVDCCLE